jgi:hypothetical protein
MRPLPLALAIWLLLSLSAAAHEAANEMVAAADQFLRSLSPELQKQATYKLTDAERENWHFVPLARQGVPLKQMNPQQRALALTLLRSGLSHTGAARAEAIISLESVLKELENDQKGRRDPTLYYVTLFDSPSTTHSWGWRFEGHHLSFNFTVIEGKHVFFAPTFMGSNPAEVRSGPRKGERVLALEDDAGRQFAATLDGRQRKLAVFSDTAPKDILTSNKKRVEPLSPGGLQATELNPEQRNHLTQLIRVYLDRSRPELAEEAFARIVAAGLDKVTFGWAGGFEPGTANYYRIQGPTFLIEFDNTQNNANHIHTVFREFKGDFGHDLLREHYARAHR